MAIIALSLAAVGILPITASANGLDGVGEIQDYGSGLCLGIPGESTAADAIVVQWTCNGHPDQTWTTQHSPNGDWQFFNNNSHLCLGVRGGSKKDLAQIVQWPCNGHPDQQWQANPSSFGSGNASILTNDNTGGNSCLGVAAGSRAVGAQVVLFHCKQVLDQSWFVNFPFF